MRLSEREILAGITHESSRVRVAALSYFTKSYSRSPEVMPAVIEAARRWGLREAFPHVHFLGNLAHDDRSVAWAIEQLAALKGDQENKLLANELGNILRSADLGLVQSHWDAISAVSDDEEELSRDCRARIWLSSQDDEVLWRILEESCETEGFVAHLPDIGDVASVWIVEALARHPSVIPRMMTVLAQSPDEEYDPAAILQIHMAQLAGEMRHLPAVPLLVDAVQFGYEMLGEEAVAALIQMQSDEAIALERVRLPRAMPLAQIDATELFGRIHSDLALAAGIELIEECTDEDVRECLASEILGQFSIEAIEAVRRMLPEIKDRFGLEYDLVSACDLMGYAPPELEQWRDTLDKREAYLAETLARLDAGVDDFDEFDGDEYDDDELEDTEFEDDYEGQPMPSLGPLHAPQKIGRNEPCPCGSGKKFKKCCLNKTQDAQQGEWSKG